MTYPGVASVEQGCLDDCATSTDYAGPATPALVAPWRQFSADLPDAFIPLGRDGASHLSVDADAAAPDAPTVLGRGAVYRSTGVSDGVRARAEWAGTAGVQFGPLLFANPAGATYKGAALTVDSTTSLAYLLGITESYAGRVILDSIPYEGFIGNTAVSLADIESLELRTSGGTLGGWVNDLQVLGATPYPGTTGLDLHGSISERITGQTDPAFALSDRWRCDCRALTPPSWTVPSVKGTPTVVEASAATGATLNLPAYANGDLVLIAIYYQGGGTITPLVFGTPLDVRSNGSNVRSALYAYAARTLTALGSPASVAITTSGGVASNVAAMAVVIQNAHDALPSFSVASSAGQNNSGTTADIPGYILRGRSRLSCAFWFAFGNRTLTSVPTGYSVVAQTGSGGPTCNLIFATKTVSASPAAAVASLPGTFSGSGLSTAVVANAYPRWPGFLVICHPAIYEADFTADGLDGWTDAATTQPASFSPLQATDGVVGVTDHVDDTYSPQHPNLYPWQHLIVSHGLAYVDPPRDDNFDIIVVHRNDGLRWVNQVGPVAWVDPDAADPRQLGLGPVYDISIFAWYFLAAFRDPLAEVLDPADYDTIGGIFDLPDVSRPWEVRMRCAWGRYTALVNGVQVLPWFDRPAWTADRATAGIHIIDVQQTEGDGLPAGFIDGPYGYFEQVIDGGSDFVPAPAPRWAEVPGFAVVPYDPPRRP